LLLSSIGIVKIGDGNYSLSNTNLLSPIYVNVSPARVYLIPDIATISPAVASVIEAY